MDGLEEYLHGLRGMEMCLSVMPPGEILLNKTGRNILLQGTINWMPKISPEIRIFTLCKITMIYNIFLLWRPIKQTSTECMI